MEALFNQYLSRLIGVAGVIVLLSSAASIAVVLAWSPIPIINQSVTPGSSVAPLVVTKAYTTPRVSLTRNPLKENLKMTAHLNLHRYARDRILNQGYKMTVRFEDAPSCVFQKAVWSLVD